MDVPVPRVAGLDWCNPLILSSEHAMVIIQSANKVSPGTSLSSPSLLDRNTRAFHYFISLFLSL